MRILIINQYLRNASGEELMTLAQAALLKKNGHDVFLWGYNEQPLFDENYEYLKYFPIRKRTVKDYIFNPFRFYYDKDNAKYLKGMINAISPDIVHIQNLDDLTPSILKNLENIPTVMTYHCCPKFICPKSSLILKDNLCKENSHKKFFLPCIKNKCCKNSIEPSLRRSLFSYIMSKNWSNINFYITPSEALRKLIINADVSIEDKDIVSIPNFLDKDMYNMIPNYKNSGYFLYVGRLVKHKGVQYLLEALRNLSKEINVHIVGTGPEEENLKKFANDNNLYNVKFLGFKNREEIKDEYQNCIATILPCNWFEIFGMTNIESFINGKPVIASNIGGIPEIVDHNKTGLLFEPANVEQLKECILAYLNNPDLVIEHGKNAYQKAKSLYSEDYYYEKIIKVYENCIKNKETPCNSKI